MNKEVYFKQESYAIIGACFEVYNEKGNGFLEAVYQEALGMEFRLQNIPFTEHPKLRLFYKGIEMQQTYEPDYVCFDEIIVELKAVKDLADEHRAQVINYLKSTGKKLGLLINFGHSGGLQHERLLN